MADMIKFYKGALANLPAAGTNGALYITSDEGAIYLGTGVGMKRLGDFVQVDAVANLPTAGANTSALYYCVAENVLAKWTGTEWKQVNKQPTKDELKVLLGLDANGEVTQSIAAAKKAGDDAQTAVDNLTTYVGTIPNGEDGNPVAASVIAYINKKTDGIATSGNLEALGARVTTVEGKVSTIEGDYLKGSDKTELEGKITSAQNAADNAQSKADQAYTLADGKATMEQVNAAIAGAGHAVKNDVDQAIADLETAYKAADQGLQGEINNKVDKSAYDEKMSALEGEDARLEGLIEGNATDIKAIADDYLKGADKTALQGSIDGVSGRVTTIENDYLKASDKEALEGKIGEKVAQAAYDTKVAALEGEDARLAGLISAMDEAYKAADNGLSGRIAALESDITGLSGAMHFKGVVEALPESTEGYADGDVVVFGQKEYVVNGEAFVELGDVSAEVQRISDLEAVVNGTGEGEAHVDGLVDKVADNAAAIVAEKERAEAKEAELVKADTDNLAEAKKYTDDEIAELNIAQYAKQADLDGAVTRIGTAEGKITALETESAKHALKTEVEAVSTALTEYKNAREDDYTNTQIDEAIEVVADDLAEYVKTHENDYDNEQVDSAISTAIANAGHASASDLAEHIDDDVAHITADERNAWNAAEKNAKDYSDGKLATARTEISAEIDADVLVETNRAKGVEEGLQSAIDTINNAENGILAQAKSDAASKANTAESNAKSYADGLLQWGEF